MGLFSRKKKVEVPEPPSEDILKFPKPSEIKAIKPEEQIPQEELPVPEKIKKAVGVEKLPEELETPPHKSELPSLPEPAFPTLPEKPPFKPTPIPLGKPSFLRIQHYQMLLDEMGSIKKNTAHLNQINEHLEKSEYNENKDYERLKNNLKKIHDGLLFIDD